MKTRQLGNSSLLVTELGFGCMSLPTNFHDAQSILQTAYNGGIRFFDTADLYDKGKNEEILGEWAKDKRHEVKLATKVGNVWNNDGKTWHFDISRQHIKKSLDESLQRLQTDYIDLYQLHGGTLDDPLEEAVETMEQLKKNGVIREYGISSIRPNVIQRFLTQSSAASVMMQLSLQDRRPEEWMQFIQENKASIIARGPLAKGELTTSNELYQKALSYVLSFKEIGTVLVGASSVEQIKQTLHVYDSIKNTTFDLHDLKDFPAEKYVDHR